MKSATKLVLTAAVLGTLGLAGMAKFVFASQSAPIVAMIPERLAEKSDGDGETNDDAQEAKKLRSLAKIPAEQAQQTVEAAEKIKATQVTLENDDRNLVYAVVVGQKEVKVDAGTGKILYTEALQNDKDDKDDKNDEHQTQPRSSIQLSFKDDN